MQRRTLLQLGMGATLVTGIPGTIRRVLAAGNAPVQPGIRKLTGVVSLNGQPAREGQLVRPGDTIVTGPRSEAIYIVGQDAFLHRAETEVRFGTSTEDFLRLVTGRLLSVFGKGQKHLHVPTATIGIRGTACYLDTDTLRTYFCLCYGEAEVTPTAAPQTREVIRTQHHDHPIYIHGDPSMPTSMVPAEVVNHTDMELKLLENLVGREPPFWGRTSYRY